MPTISFSVAGRRSADIVRALAEADIAAGNGHFYGARCVEALGYPDIDDGVVRVSMVHYTSLQEVQRLIAVLEEVL